MVKNGIRKQRWKDIEGAKSGVLTVWLVVFGQAFKCSQTLQQFVKRRKWNVARQKREGEEEAEREV